MKTCKEAAFISDGHDYREKNEECLNFKWSGDFKSADTGGIANETKCWEAKNRAGDAREGFMAVVYDQLSGDPDNIRANLIIDAFDNATDHITKRDVVNGND